ncbi:MAG: VWA domain-containing protein [Chloroflexota bacterium]
MKKWLTSLLILLIMIPSYFVFAQDDEPVSLEITGANASDLPTITITTNVLDENNIPVEGLGIEDFTLSGELEGLAEIIRVENITTDDLQFATVLVIDTSTSMSGLPIEQAKAAATLFVQSVGANDPIAIVSFANRARLVQDYTTDKELLLSVIDNLRVGGQTALYDASVLGVETADTSTIPRRAVILLSDGAEFGGRSVNLREAGLETATRDGVSVYTIGLGFGTDRSYLEELALGTNARSFESPTPDELTTIYSDLASLFRSQYVITLQSDIPADGTTYEFTLQADTPSGMSNVDTGTIRAPIPVPFVVLDEALFDVPFSTPVTIMPDIRSDDDIADVNATIDGEPIDLNADGAVVIDPINYPPASYNLTVTATDVDGDTGSASVQFETAALASDVTLNFDTENDLTEPTTITLISEGQTPAVNASYSVLQGGVSIESFTSEDAENGFPFTIDPFLFESGDYELFLGVENAGGATANQTVPFTIGSIAPRNVALDGVDTTVEITEPTELTAIADIQAGARITDTSITIDGEDASTIRPATLQPGTSELMVTVTDSNGLSTSETISVIIAALPPQVSFGELETPITTDTTLSVMIESQTDIISATYNFNDNIDLDLQQRADGTYNDIPITLQMFEGDTVIINVDVLNSGGLRTTESIILDIVIPPTATPTADLEATAQAEASIATASAVAVINAEGTAQANADATSDVVATNDAEGTAQAEVNALATSDAEANAQATVDSQSTSEAQAIADEQSTADAQATVDTQSTSDAEANAQASVDEQSTADAQATVDTQSTLNAQASVDEQSTLDAQASVDAQSTADAMATSDAQATVEAQSTLDAQATGEAIATSNALTMEAEQVETTNAQATADAQSTLDTQATVDAQNTANANDAQATDDAATAVAVNVAESATPTETATDEPTVAPTATLVPTELLPTLTPVEIIEVDEQSAENPPVEGNFSGLLIACGALLLGSILLFILWFGRNRNREEAR